MPTREAYVNEVVGRERDYAETHLGLVEHPVEGSLFTTQDHLERAVHAAASIEEIAEQAGQEYDHRLELRRDLRDAIAWLEAAEPEDFTQPTLDGLRRAVESGASPQVTRMLADLERAANEVGKPPIIGTPTRRQEQLAGLMIFAKHYAPPYDNE